MESEDIKNKKDFVNLIVGDKTNKITFKSILEDPEGSAKFHRDVIDLLLYTDFDKIHDVMEHLNWDWAMWEDELGEKHYSEVPSVYALKFQIINLIDEFIKRAKDGELENRTDYYTAMGGWHLECSISDEEPKIFFSAKFILEDFNNFC